MSDWYQPALLSKKQPQQGACPQSPAAAGGETAEGTVLGLRL